MSAFLSLQRRRFDGTSASNGDHVPWELDDKKQAYDFVRNRGFATVAHAVTSSPSEALEAGRSFGETFVVKQPNRHSSKGVWLLRDLGGGEYLDLFKYCVITAADIVPDKFAPSYWLAEQMIDTSVAGHPVPLDYKVYVFGSQISHIIQIDRNVWPPRVAVFDGAFFPLELDVHYQTNPRRWLSEGHVLPLHAAGILAMARSLGEAIGTRFVRVDCYDGLQGAIFGEFTFASGPDDTGMIVYTDSVLQRLNAATCGEKIDALSGFDIANDDLYNACAAHSGPVFVSHPVLTARLACSAIQYDLRYGRRLAELRVPGRLGQHFATAARLVGIVNGDRELLLSAHSAVKRGSGFICGDGRAEELFEKAGCYHRSGGDSPWHRTCLAQLRLANGDMSALADIADIASTGYAPARRVAEAHGMKVADP